MRVSRATCWKSFVSLQNVVCAGAKILEMRARWGGTGKKKQLFLVLNLDTPLGNLIGAACQHSFIIPNASTHQKKKKTSLKVDRNDISVSGQVSCIALRCQLVLPDTLLKEVRGSQKLCGTVEDIS